MKMDMLCILATTAFAGAYAADLTVTQDTLLTRTIPAITSLSNDGTGDWTSVGETQRSDRNQERAHLNDDGELVLVDDAGFQYHAVWAASRPVTPAMSWEVSFRYIPVPNPDTKYYDAGGWTFVMQNQGATAYGTSSPLLGVPATGVPQVQRLRTRPIPQLRHVFPILAGLLHLDGIHHLGLTLQSP